MAPPKIGRHSPPPATSSSSPLDYHKNPHEQDSTLNSEKTSQYTDTATKAIEKDKKITEGYLKQAGQYIWKHKSKVVTGPLGLAKGLAYYVPKKLITEGVHALANPKSTVAAVSYPLRHPLDSLDRTALTFRHPYDSVKAAINWFKPPQETSTTPTVNYTDPDQDPLKEEFQGGFALSQSSSSSSSSTGEEPSPRNLKEGRGRLLSSKGSQDPEEEIKYTNQSAQDQLEQQRLFHNDRVTLEAIGTNQQQIKSLQETTETTLKRTEVNQGAIQQNQAAIALLMQQMQQLNIPSHHLEQPDEEEEPLDKSMDITPTQSNDLPSSPNISSSSSSSSSETDPYSTQPDLPHPPPPAPLDPIPEEQQKNSNILSAATSSPLHIS